MNMATVERIGAALRGRDVAEGQTSVESIEVAPGEDSEGAPALFVIVTLSNPPAGQETWPVDDIWALRRLFRRKILEVDPELEIPWFISFRPADADALDPEDEGDQIETDGD